MAKFHLLTLGVVSTVWSVHASATNGYFVHANSVASQGNAGVSIALFQDALGATSNPSAVSWLGNRVDVGATLFNPDRESEIKGNLYGADGHYSGNGKKYFVLPEAGITHQLNNDISVGLAVYGHGGMNTSYKQNPFAAFGNTGTAGVDLAQVFVTPTISWKYADNQAIGLSANLLYQRFAATGIKGFGAFSEDPNAISDNKHDSSTGIGAKVGWSAQLADNLTLGATYASKIKATKFDKYKGLFADQGLFDVPANYGVGIAYKPVPQLTLAADVQRIEYSDVDSVGNRFDISKVASGKLFGSSGGPGFGWDDVTVYKVGATYALNPQVTLRAGYSHVDQPIAADQTFLNILAPGVIEDHASIGATWAIQPNQSLSVAYTHGFKHKVNGNGSIPAAFGGGEANLQMQQDIFGLSYGWKY